MITAASSPGVDAARLVELETALAAKQRVIDALTAAVERYQEQAGTGPHAWRASAELELLVQRRTEQLAHELAVSRKRAREYRSKIEEHAVLRAILEAAPVAIFWTDRSGCYLGCNSAFLRLAGLDEPEQVLGRRDQDVFGAAIGPDAEQRRAIVSGSLAQISVETLVGHREGGSRPYMLTVAPLANEREVVGLLGVLADLSDVKLLEAKLSQAQRLESIGALAAGIAHEINTPLQYISSHLTFVHKAEERLRLVFDELQTMEESLPPASVDQLRHLRKRQKIDHVLANLPVAVEEAQDGVETVSRIVRAMKEFAHPGNEDKALTDLPAAISATLVVCRNEYKYVADVVTEFAPDLPKVAALEGELKQVLLNMIVNASHAIADRYGPGGAARGTITVSTCHDAASDRVVIGIADDGVGMTPEVRARIFDPFFTTKQVGRGTGQGLALAHQVVVLRHGGEIEVQSEPGAGTRFLIWLPVRADVGTTS